MINDVPLDPTSRYFLDQQHHSFEMFILEGDCDVGALVDAATRSLEDEPTFNARLVTTTSLLTTTLSLRPEGTPYPVAVVDMTDLTDTGTDYDAVVEKIFDDRIRPRGDHRPMKITVVELPGNRTMIAFEYQHVLADGTKFFAFVRTVLARYHRAVTGAEPDWAESETLHSQLDVASRVPPASRRDFIAYAREYARTYPVDRTAFLAGTPSTPVRQVSARTLLAEAETVRLLRDRARTEDASLGDLVNAATMIAAREWNAARGRPVDVLRGAVTVAVHRDRAEGTANALSGVPIGALEPDLDDHVALMRSLAAQRKSAIGRGIDQRFATLIERLQTARSIRGVGLLKHLVGSRFGGPSTDTFHFSNPGVIWPEIVDGRLSGRSAITEVGAARIADVASRYAMASPCIGVAMATIADQAQLRVYATTESMTTTEARAFGELVAGTARSFA